MLTVVLGYYALAMAGVTLAALLFVPVPTEPQKALRRSLVWLVHVGFLLAALMAFKGA